MSNSTCHSVYPKCKPSQILTYAIHSKSQEMISAHIANHPALFLNLLGPGKPMTLPSDDRYEN